MVLVFMWVIINFSIYAVIDQTALNWQKYQIDFDSKECNGTICLHIEGNTSGRRAIHLNL